MAEQFDLPRIMRMRNIFGVPEEEQVGSAKPMMDKVPVKEKKPGAFDKFMASIDELPQRQDHSPSNWRRVGAGLIGAFQGADRGQEFVQRPYRQAVGDWKLKNDALATAASQERLAETANDRDAYNRSMVDIRNRDLQGDQAIAQGRLDVANRTAANAEQRTAIERAKLGDGTIIEDKVNGKMYLKNRIGEIKELPMGVVTEADKQELITQGRLEVVDAQGRNSRAVAGINQAGANARNAATNLTSRQNTADRIAAAMERAKLAGSSAGPSGNSETQRKQGMLNRASEFIRANPDLENWIEVDDNDMVQIVPQNIQWGPEDLERHKQIIDKIRSYIDPDYAGPTGAISGSTGSVAPGNTSTPRPTPTARPAATPTTRPATAPAAPTKQPGRVIVEDQNGKRFSLPANQLQQALDTGKYIEVE